MTFTAGAPMANVSNQGTLAAASTMCSTSMFWFLPDAAVFMSPMVEKNYEYGGGYSELTGKWYPTSRLVIDGFGRRVGDDEFTTRPKGYGI
jgi:hypothetical protein